MERQRQRNLKHSRAIVLLSGGIDSATTLAIAKRENKEVIALTFDYGQRHKFEIEMAKRQAELQQVDKHIIFKIDLTRIGGSALTDDIPVPLAKDEVESHNEIPITYVPARNTIFIAVAMAYAEVLNCNSIYIGANFIDYSGYPDCRPLYFKRYQKLLNVALKTTIDGNRIKIKTPLLRKSKMEIIRLSHELGVDFSKTLSCYNPREDGSPCLVCDSCALRKKGFEKAGIPDPLISR